VICSYAFYAPVALIFPLSEWSPAVAAAAIAGTAALISTAAATARGPRERRRELYSRAFQDALAWREGLYRVRRRDNSPEQDRELVDRFHDLQERVDHHRAWLASESNFLARSYCRFVEHVKAECQPLIAAAWASPGEAPSSPVHAGALHPSGIDDQASRFLLDVRLHLWSSLVIPSIALWVRNR
jgi:hypothetical protein